MANQKLEDLHVDYMFRKTKIFFTVCMMILMTLSVPSVYGNVNAESAYAFCVDYAKDNFTGEELDDALDGCYDLYQELLAEAERIKEELAEIDLGSFDGGYAVDPGPPSGTHQTSGLGGCETGSHIC